MRPERSRAGKWPSLLAGRGSRGRGGLGTSRTGWSQSYSGPNRARDDPGLERGAGGCWGQDDGPRTGDVGEVRQVLLSDAQDVAPAATPAIKLRPDHGLLTICSPL